jgi:hypothetical protein
MEELRNGGRSAGWQQRAKTGKRTYLLRVFDAGDRGDQRKQIAERKDDGAKQQACGGRQRGQTQNRQTQ